jgi:cysteinyl-tRNA synthetase
VLFDIAKALNRAKKDALDVAGSLAQELRRLGGVMGLLEVDPDLFLKGEQSQGAELSAEDIESLIVKRNEARKAKDFAESDRIRDLLKDDGVILNDSRAGTTWHR